jgi:hypothetical protein
MKVGDVGVVKTWWDILHGIFDLNKAISMGSTGSTISRRRPGQLDGIGRSHCWGGRPNACAAPGEIFRRLDEPGP